jgi:dTMP kinase
VAIKDNMSEIIPTFSLEGIDGSGKSTQQLLVQQALESMGIQVALPTSPSHNVLGELIRSNVNELEPSLRNKLFLLDIEHTAESIGRDNQVDIVLWDRHIDSFYTSNPEMSPAEARTLTSKITVPRKTFLLDVSVEVIMKSRGEVHDHHTIPEWLEMKVDRYKELAMSYPDRIIVIDGNAPRDEVTSQIVGSVLEHL